MEATKTKKRETALCYWLQWIRRRRRYHHLSGFFSGKQENIPCQEICTKGNIKKYLSGRRKMIPDGSPEIWKETNNENGKYVSKSK